MPAPHLQNHEVRDPNWRPRDNSLFQIFLWDNMLVSVIFDKDAQRFVFLKSMPADTPLLALQENAGSLFDDLSPENVNIFLSTPKTALIPGELYEAEDQSAFFKLNHAIEENDNIYELHVNHLNAVLLFAAKEEVEQVLTRLEINWTLYHTDGCWLEVLHMLHRDREGVHVHIDIQPDVMTIAVIKDAGLLLYNTFMCSTPEDRLYFVMFISEQLKISPQKDSYFLSGQIHRSDDSYLLFARYIARMQMEPRPDIYQYALPFHELPEHFYFKAYCSPVCE